MERMLPRPMPESYCLIEVGWMLAACRERWATEYRWVSTSLPVSAVARAAGHTAKALAAELAAGELYRARTAFQLPV